MIEGLGEKLKRARMKAGLTQDQVFELTGIARSTISAYEKDTIDDPSAASLRKLASVYRVDPNYLFGFDPRQILIVDDLNEEQFKAIKLFVDALTENNRINKDEK